MTISMPPECLDEVLALQVVIAWAGEAAGGTNRRLGWWNTDIVDAEGGGDLWKRLLPRTHHWAALDSARRAARLIDAKARQRHARADEMLTLFHFGFHADEALDERLAHHKLEERPPPEVLPLTEVLGRPFEPAALLERLEVGTSVPFKVIPGGRQLKGPPPERLDDAAHQLACAMLRDTPKEYPLPFFLTEDRRAER